MVPSPARHDQEEKIGYNLATPFDRNMADPVLCRVSGFASGTVLPPLRYKTQPSGIYVLVCDWKVCAFELSFISFGREESSQQPWIL